MLVVCYDQKTNSQIGAISASWRDVQDYMLEREFGSQLEWRVTEIVIP